MPRPSKSTLTKPISLQSSLSHCTTTRPGMLAGSSGTIWSRPSLTQDHTARVLPQMPRQTQDLTRERQEMPDPPVLSGKPHFFHRPVEGVLWLPFQGWYLFRGSDYVLFGEPEHFADVANRRSCSIVNDVGRHRRAVGAVTGQHILDHLLALGVARQIEIDVGPLASFF